MRHLHLQRQPLRRFCHSNILTTMLLWRGFRGHLTICLTSFGHQACRDFRDLAHHVPASLGRGLAQGLRTSPTTTSPPTSSSCSRLSPSSKSDENWQRVLQPAMTGNGCCDQRGIGNGCCALLRVHHRFRGQCRHLVHCRGRSSGRRSLEVVANVVLHTSVDVRSSEPPGLRSWWCGFSGASDLLEALGIDIHCR